MNANTSGYPVPQKATALILEIVLSLFGVFGIGWLYAGKTTPGVILLVCGVFFIWGGYAAFLSSATILASSAPSWGVIPYCCVCLIMPIIQIVGAVLSTVMLNSSAN